MNIDDPGLQPQRTALAWSRTALSLLVNAVLVLRSYANSNDRYLLSLGVLILLSAICTSLCGMKRASDLEQGVLSLSSVGYLTLFVALSAGFASLSGVVCILITN